MINFITGSLVTLAAVFLIGKMTESRPLWQKAAFGLVLVAAAVAGWWVITGAAGESGC